MRIWVLAMALTALFSFSSTAVAQDRCADVLVEGTKSGISQYAESLLETANLINLTRSSQSNTSIKLPLPEGVPGPEITDAHKAQLSRQELNWLRSHSVFSYLNLSGDPYIVGAWLKCMELDHGGGPVARFEAKDGVIRLIMMMIPSKVNNYSKTFTIKHDISLPSDFPVEEDGNQRCLKAGAVIDYDEGGCVVTFKDTNKRATVNLTITTDQKPLMLDLPPRLRVRSETTNSTFTVSGSVPPSQNGDHTQTHNLDPEKGTLVIESVKSEATRVTGGMYRGQQKASCKPKLPFTISDNNIVATYHLDNNSRNDSAGCTGTVSYRQVKLIAEEF